MINKELHHFVSQYLKKKVELAETSEVFKVLDLPEDKVFEFMNSYSRQFNVDISGFDSDLYLDSGSPHSRPLTIGDLERGVAMGYLNSSVIDLEDSDINLHGKQSVGSIIVAVVVCVITALILGFVTYYI